MSQQETFEGKADLAGERLKEQLGLEPRKVQVGADGREAKPPPPGSYAAMALEEQQRERAAAAQTAGQAVTEGGSPHTPAVQPPVDGMTSDPASPGEGERSGEEETPGARARIAELTRLRREEERKRQEAEAERSRLQQELERSRATYSDLETAHQQLLEQNLDHLDPDERARVVARAETLQLVEASKREIMDSLRPTVNRLQEEGFHRELMSVADKYPGYDHNVHATLIHEFMSRNPAVTVEQAFRAVANDEELYLRSVSQPSHGNGAPAFIPPRGTTAASKQAPAAEDDPNEGLRKESKRVHELARSKDPRDQREHTRAVHDLLKRRLGG